MKPFIWDIKGTESVDPEFAKSTNGENLLPGKSPRHECNFRATYVDEYLQELYALFDLEANDLDFIDKIQADQRLDLHFFQEDSPDDLANDIFDHLIPNSQSPNTNIGENDFIFRECLNYYYRIIQPFSPKIGKKIKSLLEVKFPQVILNSDHCSTWKQETLNILENYRYWTEK